MVTLRDPLGADAVAAGRTTAAQRRRHQRSSARPSQARDRFPPTQTSPAIDATISVNPRFTRQWGVDWERLVAGAYTVSFAYPGAKVAGKATKIPSPTGVEIRVKETAAVSADLTTGVTRR